MGFQRCAYVRAFLRGLGGAEEQEILPPNTVYGMRMRHGAIRLWKNAQGYLARCVGRKGGIPSFESVKEVQNQKNKKHGHTYLRADVMPKRDGCNLLPQLSNCQLYSL